MIWVQLAWFLVTTLVSAAIGPKPPKPKAASLEDFDLPTAEEDRPIPVIFGEVDITGPNVVGADDFRSKAIKKSSLFGSQTIGYRYFLGLHFVFGHGEADAITNIRIGEKQAWSGSITANGSGTINQPDLFGGKKKEGGVVGDFDILFGGATQPINSYIQTKIRKTGPTPAYRGVVSLVWKGGEIGNSPYLKGWEVRLRRILKGWATPVWNSAQATIDTNKMNPAHILYECITNPEWGLGEPTSSIDTVSWGVAAQTFFDEGFGLALLWNNQTTVDDFLETVLDHVGGLIGIRHDTGQYVLKVIRADYDPEDLDEYDESEIKAVTHFQRQGWGDTINELTLSYTDPDTRKVTSITVQDLANIRVQGRIVPHSVSYPGIRDHDLAAKVAARELLAVSTPLAKITFEINRRFWRKSQGDVVSLSYDDHELSSVPFRILKTRGGTLKDGRITVDAVEDIFGLPGSIYLTNQGSSDPPTVPPIPDDRGTGPSVIATDINVPPSSPVDGDRYFIPKTPTPTGAWAGHGGEFAEWDAEDNAWEFSGPEIGVPVYNEDTGEHFTTDEDGDVLPAPWSPAIPPLTVDAAPNLNEDYLLIYDSSAGTYKKVLGNKVGGGGGGGSGGGGIAGVSLESAIMADAPTGYWKADEASGSTILDYSGNAFDLAISGSPSLAWSHLIPTLPTTKFLRFPVGSAYRATRAGALSIARPITGDWTVEGIVHITDLAGDVDIFFIGGNGESEVVNYQVLFKVEAGEIEMLWETAAGTNVEMLTGIVLGEARTYHIAVVKDGTANTVTFYVNGIKLKVMSYGSEPSGGTDASVVTGIGSDVTSGAATGDYTIGHVAFYNGVKLSQDRILAHAIAAGLFGAAYAPASVDSYPETINSMNDEFEGTALGSKWAWRNQGGATVTFEKGCLILSKPQESGSDNIRMVEQSITSTWKVQAKLAVHSQNNNYQLGGLLLYNTSANRMVTFGFVYNSQWLVYADRRTLTTFTSNLTSVAASSTALHHPSRFAYLEVERTATQLILRYSANGLRFITFHTETLSSYVEASGTIDKVGIGALASTSGGEPCQVIVDWFRRIA